MAAMSDRHRNDIEPAAGQPARSAVEAALRRLYGGTVTVEIVDRIGAWAVARCAVSGSPSSLGSVPGSVIVKWLRSHDGGFRTDPTQVRTELAALQFVESLGVTPALAPRALSHDLEHDLLVVEDVAAGSAPRIALDALLRRDGAATHIPERLAFARSIGRLHAATAGRSADFLARRHALGPFDAQAERTRFADNGLDGVVQLADILSVPATGDVQRDVADVRQALAQPGVLLALSNGDSAPNNFLVGADRDGRLIDFEFASFRHALCDITWMHVPGPAWIVVADPIAAELETAYRAAAVEGIPELGDDRMFGAGLATAALTAALERLGPPRFQTLDARPPGEQSRVQQVATFEAAAAVAVRFRCLPHLAGWLQAAADALRARWPDADIDLDSLAPYTPRG